MNELSKEKAKSAIEALMRHPTAYFGEAEAREVAGWLSELLALRKVQERAEPVAWQYEWAQCVTCEGPQDFKHVIETEAPPGWAITDGRVKNLRKLYAEQPAPVVPEYLERLRSLISDPQKLPRRKELISGQRYSYVLLEDVEAMVDDACRAAMLDAPPATVVVPDIDRKAICTKVHGLCTRSPGAAFYNAAEYTLDEVAKLQTPPAPAPAPGKEG